MAKVKMKAVRLEVLVPGDLKLRLQAMARRNERSMSREAVLAIRQHVQQEETNYTKGARR
jgi:predicted transcriptional regulator